ncbi:MAG TPA: TetR/AcrR family transcriptional regulator [Epsilonproteobacteria bacterium]|nr:TetR/AcrR family transcriptional regulator [Campylobacterota bacterium]
MSRKLDILETARRLFNESNTQAVTTNHIAKAMGISPGNLHYHYKNREEIIRLLYRDMRAKMSLSIDALPKTLEALEAHQKVLIGIQWEYRFFFREMLFLFSRDAELQREYIEDNIAHRSRIKLVLESFVESGELNIDNEILLEYIVDAILMAWQFYTSYMQTLGRPLSRKSAEEAVQYASNTMKPYKVKQEKV